MAPHLRHYVAFVTTYRISEAAELLGVSDDTVRRWVDSGALAASGDDAGPQRDRRRRTSRRWPSSAPQTPDDPAAGSSSRATGCPAW